MRTEVKSVVHLSECYRGISKTTDMLKFFKYKRALMCYPQVPACGACQRIPRLHEVEQGVSSPLLRSKIQGQAYHLPFLTFKSTHSDTIELWPAIVLLVVK